MNTYCIMVKKRTPPFYGVVFLGILVFLTVCGTRCIAQGIEPEALFKRGLARYQQGKYVSARLDFSEIVVHHQTSLRISAAYVMLSKTFFALGDYDSAESTALSLKNSYPDSRYAEWAQYMIAACGFRRGDTD